MSEMKPKILLIEDNKDVQESILECLEHLDVVAVSSLRRARVELERAQFDLVLLDISLPDGDGMQFCAALRSDPKTKSLPVMFLTGHAAVSEKVIAFSLGAEDYITKPFGWAELKARIDAKLKRIAQSRQDHDVFTRGNLKFDLSRQRVTVISDGKEQLLDLTPLEFKLLALFATGAERVFSRNQIMDHVWSNDVHVLDRTIDTHISNLRKKITGSFQDIHTIYGSGYFLGPVTVEKMVKRRK